MFVMQYLKSKILRIVCSTLHHSEDSIERASYISKILRLESGCFSALGISAKVY